MYSGTLGYKHNPDLILSLAKEMKDDESVVVLVTSEGKVVGYMKQVATQENISNIKFLPFQPFEDMPSMLGAADILIGVLEKEAGIFSVPSKVLTYLTSGKPIVLAVPKVNLASKIISQNNAGILCNGKRCQPRF